MGKLLSLFFNAADPIPWTLLCVVWISLVTVTLSWRQEKALKETTPHPAQNSSVVLNFLCFVGPLIWSGSPLGWPVVYVLGMAGIMVFRRNEVKWAKAAGASLIAGFTLAISYLNAGLVSALIARHGV